MSPAHALTLPDVLSEHGRSWPDQLAVVDGDVRLTYEQLDARVHRLARGLRALGVGRGDRVLWLGQNSFRLLECLLAAGRLGASFCPANWRQSAEEMAFVLGDLAPSVVVWQDAEIGDVVRRAREREPAGTWVRHDGPEYDELLGEVGTGDELGVDTDPGDPVLLMYTAAFSGRPNAAMLSHTALIGQALMVGRLAGVDASYTYLDCGPLFHIATLFFTLATFVHAGTNVFTPRVEAEELCRLIEAERCTGAFLMGPTIEQMLDVNRERRFDLSSLRAFAGRPEWNEMITVDTSPWARNPGGYGQTEVTGLLTFTALGDTAIGGHGRPSPLATMRIVDPEDHEVRVGETGEIAVRGPLVMNGYWNRPEENARRFRGGWYHTNDLGRREPDGSLTFVGPKTRVIKSAAENIYPAEVEGCLVRHPAVAEAAVIGVPDRRWNQRVVAVVACQEGNKVEPDELIEHCRAHIASYKKPTAVEFVDALPRRGGVVDYDDLDARFGGGGYPGAGA